MDLDSVGCWKSLCLLFGPEERARLEFDQTNLDRIARLFLQLDKHNARVAIVLDDLVRKEAEKTSGKDTTRQKGREEEGNTNLVGIDGGAREMNGALEKILEFIFDNVKIRRTEIRQQSLFQLANDLIVGVASELHREEGTINREHDLQVATRDRLDQNDDMRLGL